MDDFKTELVAALRSGEYQQIKGRLHDGVGYCCLGVACVLAGIEPVKQRNGNWHFHGKKDLLPASVRKRLGWWTSVGDIRATLTKNGESCGSLAQLNDNGATFAEIADVIESNAVVLSDD